MKFQFTRVSSNKKTGKIPTTMSAKDTCPATCPLNGNGCYAQNGPTNIWWTKISNGVAGLDEVEFIQQIKKLPKGQLWRHNVAGDLPHDAKTGKIDTSFLKKLVDANRGKNGYTYTHHELSEENVAALVEANTSGFTVNHSANTATEAVAVFKEAGIPVVTLMPMDAPNVQSVDGVKIVACPAEKSDKVNCENCGLCAIADRDYIIGFRAHGVSKKKVEIIARG